MGFFKRGYKWFLLLFIICFSFAIAGSPPEGLVNIKDVNPGIIVELKYATTDNFMKQKVYQDSTCYVLAILAKKLDKAQIILEKDGLGLKIFDGFRPISVQKKMWDILPDSRFVANPNRGGSIHNRGVAVDLTLVDNQGNELDMPTPFDSFTTRAYQFSMEPTPQQRVNRMLLRKVMLEVGLEPISTEWWHYQIPGGKQYPIINL